MKKKIILSMLFLSILWLSACWFQQKKETPEDVVRQTQSNIIDQLKKIVLAKKKVDYRANLKVNVDTPMWWWNVKINLTGEVDNYTWSIYVNLQWDWKIQNKWWDIKLQWGLITTTNNIYIRLSELDVNIPDPNIVASVTMAKMFLNKWFYIPLPDKYTNSFNNNALNNIDIQKIIKKYDLLKVNKELWKYRYDVSLNKESIKKMIIDINKQINPDFSWNIEDINLDWDINWVLSIDDSKTYFEFSWNVLTNEQKVPVIVKYLLDKFYIDLPILTIDLDKEWNKFKWYLLIKSTNIKTNISWILTSDKFVLNILYNENPVNVKLDFDYEAKSIWKTNVKIPKDAISYDKMMNLLFWWINNNMLKDENK